MECILCLISIAYGILAKEILNMSTRPQWPEIKLFLKINSAIHKTLFPLDVSFLFDDNKLLFFNGFVVLRDFVQVDSGSEI